MLLDSRVVTEQILRAIEWRYRLRVRLRDVPFRLRAAADTIQGFLEPKADEEGDAA